MNMAMTGWGAESKKRTAAVRAAMTAPASVVHRTAIRRSTLSATAPDTKPSRKKGAMRAADAAPTMSGEPVTSRTSQPSATNSMPMPTDWTTPDSHRCLKSLYRNDAVHAAPTTIVDSEAMRALARLGMGGPGAEGRIRTDTSFTSPVFETGASTTSATSARPAHPILAHRRKSRLAEKSGQKTAARLTMFQPAALIRP